MMSGGLIAVDHIIDHTIVTIRGYDLSLRQLWSLYEVLDCMYSTQRALYECKELRKCFCFPCKTLLQFNLMVRDQIVQEEIQKKMDTILPSSETVSSCMSKHYKNMNLFQQKFCDDCQKTSSLSKKQTSQQKSLPTASCLKELQALVEIIKEYFKNKNHDSAQHDFEWPEGMCDTVVAAVTLDDKLKNCYEPAWGWHRTSTEKPRIFHFWLKEKNTDIFVDPTAQQFDINGPEILEGSREEFEAKGYMWGDQNSMVGPFTHTTILETSQQEVQKWLSSSDRNVLPSRF